MSRKVKLKSLHVFMTMILLLGLLQPALVLAADSTNVEDGNEEEVIVEKVEGTEEVEEIEETSAEKAEESIETAENSEEEGPEEAEVNTEIEESAEEEDVPTETAESAEEEDTSTGTEESAEEEDASTGTEESVAEIAGLTQSLYNDADIEFTFELRPDRTSQWDLARSGINFVLWGPNGEDATLTIGDETIEFEVRYFHEDVITADLAPGTYDVEVTIGNTTETEQLVVVSNEEYYGDDSSDPLLESRHMVLTKSEAEEIETIRVYADDLYEHTSIDVFVNDVRVESFYHDWGGASADIGVSGLPLGAHTIAFVHPTGIAEMTLIIVPDEQGAPAPAGTYEGTTIQYIGGSHMLDNPFELPIKFEVDEDGTIKNLEVEYWWVCVLADGQSGFSTSVEMPDTQITVNQAFQIDWEEGASPYSLVGIIHEDGTASGTFFNYSGACGMGTSEWNLESDTPPVPQPEPEDFEVDLAPDTTEETEGSVMITVATTSDSDITSLKWLTGDRTVADFADAGNEIDLETKSFTVDENGTYTVYALNTEDVEAVSTIVVDNIITPDPEIEFSFELLPDRISQWELVRSGFQFSVDGSGIHEGTVSFIGQTEKFTLEGLFEGTLRADLSPGTYPVTVTIGNTSKTLNLEVVNDDEFWEETMNPTLSTGRVHVLTKSEAEESGSILVVGSDFYTPASIDVLVNGSIVKTINTGDYFPDTEIDISNLPIGEHKIEFIHPTGSAGTTINIVSDESGQPVATGTFEGLTHQYMAGSRELEDPLELPIKFEVDENGVIQNLEVEYWWFCALADPGDESGYNYANNIPSTQLTVNQPFQIDWYDTGDFSLVGVINEDGTASGKFFAYSYFACGIHAADWNLVSDMAPDPVPEVFEVDLVPDTTGETDGPVTITITTTSDSDITSLKWLTGDKTAADFADAGNDIDLETKSFTVGENGTYTIFASNAEGVIALSTIEVSNIVEPDPIDPEPTDPEPTDPEPTDPEPTDPEPTDPEPTDPEPTDPEPTDPEPTDPEPTDPEPTDPTNPGDDTDPGVSIEPDGDTDAEDNTLPKTATHLFNLLSIGYVIFMIGFALLFFRRKQNA